MALILSERELSELSEADLRTRVVMPLMTKMGYRGVFEWHGGEELGKDVVGWKEVEFGERENTAVVAKATRISGSSAAGDAAKQVREAFNTPFLDPLTQEEQWVHRVWVVTNKRLRKQTRKQIRAQIDPAQNRHVRLLDGEEIWDEWRKRFPVELHQAVLEAHRRLKDADFPYRTRVWLDEDEAGVEVGERYPGQFADRPIEVKGQFRFPDTPEGLALFEEVRKAFETGAKVEVPGEYVDLRLPEDIEHLGEQILGFRATGTERVEIGTGESEYRAPVRLQIDCDDGDTAILPYIELRGVQVGSKEMTLSNAHQPYPILVTIVARDESRTADVKIRPKGDSLAAPVLFDLLLALDCLKRPCSVEILSVETGLRLFSTRRDEHAGPGGDPKYLGVVADLAAVQGKIGRPIRVPFRDLTDDEWRTINGLRALLREPKVSSTWTAATLSLAARDAMATMMRFLGSGGRALVVEAERAADLFGTEIPLGRVRTVLEGATLVNDQEILDRLKHADDPDQEIVFRFEPRGRNRKVDEYLDWGRASN